MFKKSLTFFIFISVSLFYSSSSVFAYFREDFNSDFSHPESWEVSNSSGISFDSTSILLSQSTGKSFPYINSKVPLITPDDLNIELGFRFISAGGFGNGFAVTDVNPPLGTVMTYPAKFSQYSMFYVWQNYLNPYLHIVTSLCPTSTPQCGSGTARIIYQTQSVDLSSHVIKIVKVDNQYSVYLDGNYVWTSAPTSRVAQNIWIGHPETTNTTNTWSRQSIDYLEIGESPISFPYLSQLDPVWRDHEYDSASEWAGIEKSGIGRWGCAITSTAMMLRYYGVKTPEGADVTPDNLNTWLKSQPDGYIGPGLLNWLAITRYTKDRVPGEKKSLEYVRTTDPASATLPSIFGLPGHFVLAHGEDTLNWKINDPANMTKTELQKTSTIKSINTYVRSNSDLSYMLFVAEPGVDAALIDPNGMDVNLTWTEEYLTDDQDATQGSLVKIAMLAKPADGEYHLQINNQSGSAGKVEAYLYDRDGEVVPNDLFVPPQTEAGFVIQYSPDPAQTGLIALDYNSIFDYLRSLRVPKSPANGIFQALYDKFGELIGQTTTDVEVSKYIAKQSPKHINADTKAILQNYIMLIEGN